MASWITGHLFALLIGLNLGLIGSGGSILTVPILIYILGLEVKTAIAMSLVIVATISFIGLIPHWKLNNINLDAAMIFTPPAMLGTFLGARLAALTWITDTWQLIGLVIAMLIASYEMIHQSQSMIHDFLASSTVKKYQSASSELAIVASGLGVGIFTGFVGIGGGLMIIPILVSLRNIPLKEAVGTSLLIITFKSATGFLGYLNQVNIDWNLMLSFTTVAVLGVIWGAYFSSKIQSNKLQQAFGYFLIPMAILILLKH